MRVDAHVFGTFRSHRTVHIRPEACLDILAYSHGPWAAVVSECDIQLESPSQNLSRSTECTGHRAGLWSRIRLVG